MKRLAQWALALLCFVCIAACLLGATELVFGGGSPPRNLLARLWLYRASDLVIAAWAAAQLVRR